jgi:hypothetical protein
MDGFREYDPNITDEEIIRDAMALWKEIDDYEATARGLMLDDIKFENGDVYSQDDHNLRKGRPMLNIPRINQFLNHVKNDMRQNKASMDVLPRGADNEEIAKQRVKAAERRKGLIRFIQNNSRAQDAFQQAYDKAVGPGRGFIHVKSQWVSGKSFDQEIVIEYIRDVFSVYMDRSREETSYADAKYGFILDRMSKKVFQAKYPDAHPDHWTSNQTNSWMSNDDVTIAIFYCTWIKKRKLFVTHDNVMGYMDELKNLPQEAQEDVKANIARTRTVDEPYIMCYKMTSLEILEDPIEIPGKYIPIVPMIGYEEEVDGELEIRGLTRFLKDSCKLYNYAASQECERLAFSPKVPFIIADGQIEGYEKFWQNANDNAAPFLPYKAKSVDGTLVPKPTREPPVMVDSGLVNAKMGYVEDMKAVTGIYDASLGARGNETSGKAILARERQGDNANYHYIDNARICITQVCQIVNDWLPVYYDTNRVVTILGEEMDPQQLELGGMEDGEEITLGDGEFDVVVTMGPGWNTKRQEAVEFMMELVRAAPQVTPLIYDLMVKNMDAPGAQEIADRLKKTIPPEILEEKGGEKQLQANLQQAMQQVQQDQQIIEALTQQLETAMQELESNNAELSNKLEVERLKIQGNIAVAEIKALSEREKEASRVASQYFTSFQSTKPGVNVNE